jgi:hypothetical protein
MCDNRLFKRIKSSSFLAAPSLSKISKFYVSKETSSSFVLILLTVSWPRCLFLGSDTSMVDALHVERADSFEGSDSIVGIYESSAS